jgi:hypothetical protein
MDSRGHDRQLVASELRTRPVPVRASAHHQAQGTSEALSRSASGKVLLRGSQKLQAGGGAAIRAVRQLAGLRSHHFVAAASSRKIQLYLHVVVNTSTPPTYKMLNFQRHNSRAIVFLLFVLYCSFPLFFLQCTVQLVFFF